MSTADHEAGDPAAGEAAAGPATPDESTGAEESVDARGPDEASAQEASAQVASPEQQLAERTADLQRLQAEYLNYKRRVDRDRDTLRKSGEAAVLQALLTTLDDIGRAREHGELEGGFKSVADSINAVAGKFGLEAFGAKGDAFDPQLHEAVFHAGQSPEVDVTSVDNVMLTGYRVGDRVLRAATVGVIDPAAADQSAKEPASEPASGQDAGGQDAGGQDSQA